MGRYRKIEVSTWGDAKFRKLSAIPPCGQGLWLYLLTGWHTSIIPGLFRSGRLAMAEALGWTTEAFGDALAEVMFQGLMEADWKAQVCWIKNALKYNPPASPNVVRAWANELAFIPECELKDKAVADIKSFLSNMGDAYLGAFMPSVKPSRKPSVKPSGKPKPKAKLNQEQEQEQEQEKNSSTPDSSEEIVFEIAKAHPKLAHLRNEMEIPGSVLPAIWKALGTDDPDVILRGTKAFAATIKPEEVKFAMAPERFFDGFHYRQHAKQKSDPCLVRPEENFAMRNRG